MKLTIIRHGDPDYDHDTLTPRGWKEAQALADRVCGWEVKQFFVSPLGRAKDTASCALKRMGRDAEQLEWLREFTPPYIRYPSTGEKHIVWDWLPDDWTTQPEFLDPDLWKRNRVMREGGIPEYYDHVTKQFDQVLSRFGYEREGRIYRAAAPSHDRLVFFCHFGLECVLLSHLLNVSPMVLWHGCAAAPTSVTTLVTEERREGRAYFRMLMFGDVSHLLAAGLEPSPSARFCETWTDPTRHD